MAMRLPSNIAQGAPDCKEISLITNLKSEICNLKRHAAAAHFVLDSAAVLGLNRRDMKTIAFMMAAVLATGLLSSCGECPCHANHSDYLRDVPVTTSRSFN